VADLADAVAVNQGRKLAGEPARLVAEALALDPNHPKALALAGTAAFEVGDYATAVRHWEKLAAVEPADSPLAEQARASAQEAKRLAGGAAGSPSNPAPTAGPGPAGAAPVAPATAGASAGRPSAATATAAASVSGTVTLAPALKAQARPDDTVFVFARAAQGPRMPLAILRAQVKDLPLSFTLDDRQAMAAGAGLSSATQVVVGARISRSGQATAQSGDLEVLSEPVAVGAQNLRLEISRVVP
jgi:cytochrome c-type biogenesis protein CcmH